MLLLYLLVLLYPFDSNASQSSDLDGSYMTVWFDPRVFSDLNEKMYGYSDKDIMTMLDIVSTRFSRLYAPENNDYRDSYNRENYISPGFLTIAKRVARRNNIAAKTGNKTLQISMVQSNSIWTLFDTNIDAVVSEIADINSIFEGTINSVILQPAEFQLRREEDLKIFLHHYRAGLNKINVKLGIQLDYKYCDRLLQSKYEDEVANGNIPPLNISLSISEFTLPERTKFFLTSVDFVIFEEETRSLYPTPEKTVESLKQLLSLCEKAVESELGKEFSVHTTFVIESKPINESISPKKLAETWQLLGKMASEKKRDIFLRQAFDTPYKELSNKEELKSEAYTGWWALKDENATEITEESFIEKFEMGIPKFPK